MDTIIKTQIIDLIHREVIPAIGCTEPIAVALAAAKAAEVLGRKPEKIEVYLSANILKNAMGVGIPGTGMVGLPIAIALGSIIGKSAYGLEVLKDLTPEGLKEGKEMVCKKCIGIDLKENVDKLCSILCSSPISANIFFLTSCISITLNDYNDSLFGSGNTNCSSLLIPEGRIFKRL